MYSVFWAVAMEAPLHGAHALIDCVEVDADNRISITLRYRDEYRALLQLLEAGGEAVPA